MEFPLKSYLKLVNDGISGNENAIKTTLYGSRMFILGRNEFLNERLPRSCDFEILMV